VEPLSLDEAFLDVTDGGVPATELAVRIKMEIRRALGLTASAGVGPSKLVAKIASDFGKPDGLTVVRPARVRAFLHPLPVRRLWGVGPITEKKLQARGWETIGQLARAPRDQVAQVVGSFAGALIRMAEGDDDRPVTAHRETRSISSERTLDEDTLDTRELEALLARFAEELADALRAESGRARTVVLKLRYADFKTITRSVTPASAVTSAQEILSAGRGLLGRTRAGRQRVRLIGLGLHNLIAGSLPWQPPLFAP
jgi:DNA polymerase-4